LRNTKSPVGFGRYLTCLFSSMKRDEEKRKGVMGVLYLSVQSVTTPY
jgi:hypothetical protein